jgi:hypothetical protein
VYRAGLPDESDHRAIFEKHLPEHRPLAATPGAAAAEGLVRTLLSTVRREVELGHVPDHDGSSPWPPLEGGHHGIAEGGSHGQNLLVDYRLVERPLFGEMASPFFRGGGGSRSPRSVSPTLRSARLSRCSAGSPRSEREAFSPCSRNSDRHSTRNALYRTRRGSVELRRGRCHLFVGRPASLKGDVPLGARHPADQDGAIGGGGWSTSGAGAAREVSSAMSQPAVRAPAR